MTKKSRARSANPKRRRERSGRSREKGRNRDPARGTPNEASAPWPESNAFEADARRASAPRTSPGVCGLRSIARRDGDGAREPTLARAPYGQGASNQRDSAAMRDDAGAVFSDAGMLAESQSPASIWFKISAPPLSSSKRVNEGRALEVARGAPARTSARARDAAERERASHPRARVDASTRRRVDASTRRAATGDARASRELRCRIVSAENARRPRSRHGEGRRLVLGGGGAPTPRSRRARPRGAARHARLGRRGERARGRRGGRGGRERPARGRASRAGTDVFAKRAPKPHRRRPSRDRARARVAFAARERRARGGRGVSSVRDAEVRARPRSRARPACSRRARSPRICGVAWATRKSFSPSETLPATNARTTRPRGSGSRESAENEHLVGRGARRRAPQRREPRRLIRAVVDADKGDKAEPATRRPPRPARGKRGERRRERDAGSGAARARRRSKTEDEIEKNDSDEPVLGQTSRESREDKRIADRREDAGVHAGLETRNSRLSPPAFAASARAFDQRGDGEKNLQSGPTRAIPDDAQKRTESRVDSVESLGWRRQTRRLRRVRELVRVVGGQRRRRRGSSTKRRSQTRARRPRPPQRRPRCGRRSRRAAARGAPARARRARPARVPAPAASRSARRDRGAASGARRRAAEARARAESERAEARVRGCARSGVARRSFSASPPRSLRARASAARTSARREPSRPSRRRRAEETREARIANLVKKASERAQNRAARCCTRGHRQQESRAAREAVGGGASAARASRGAPRRRRGGGVARARRRSSAASPSTRAPALEERVSARKERRRDERARELRARRTREAARTRAAGRAVARGGEARRARPRGAPRQDGGRRADAPRLAGVCIAADARRRAYLNVVRERAVERTRPSVGGFVRRGDARFCTTQKPWRGRRLGHRAPPLSPASRFPRTRRQVRRFSRALPPAAHRHARVVLRGAFRSSETSRSTTASRGASPRTRTSPSLSPIAPGVDGVSATECMHERPKNVTEKRAKCEKFHGLWRASGRPARRLCAARRAWRVRRLARRAPLLAVFNAQPGGGAPRDGRRVRRRRRRAREGVRTAASGAWRAHGVRRQLLPRGVQARPRLRAWRRRCAMVVGIRLRARALRGPRPTPAVTSNFFAGEGAGTERLLRRPEGRRRRAPRRRGARGRERARTRRRARAAVRGRAVPRRRDPAIRRRRATPGPRARVELAAHRRVRAAIPTSFPNALEKPRRLRDIAARDSRVRDRRARSAESRRSRIGSGWRVSRCARYARSPRPPTRQLLVAFLRRGRRRVRSSGRFATASPRPSGAPRGRGLGRRSVAGSRLLESRSRRAAAERRELASRPASRARASRRRTSRTPTRPKKDDQRDAPRGSHRPARRPPTRVGRVRGRSPPG